MATPEITGAFTPTTSRQPVIIQQFAPPSITTKVLSSVALVISVAAIVGVVLLHFFLWNPSQITFKNGLVLQEEDGILKLYDGNDVGGVEPVYMQMNPNGIVTDKIQFVNGMTIEGPSATNSISIKNGTHTIIDYSTRGVASSSDYDNIAGLEFTNGMTITPINSTGDTPAHLAISGPLTVGGITTTGDVVVTGDGHVELQDTSSVKFTGANVNTVTKSGTNEFQASAYTYYRNESFIGNTVRGQQAAANPDLEIGRAHV